MSSKESVLKVLQSLKSAKTTARNAKVIADWRKAVEELYEHIGKWLKDAKEKELLTVNFTKSFHSDEFGEYEMRDMLLTTPDATEILIAPVTPHGGGRKGRVDFRCIPKERMLVLTEKNFWGFADRDAVQGYRLRPLTEDAFWDTIADLLSVRAP